MSGHATVVNGHQLTAQADQPQLPLFPTGGCDDGSKGSVGVEDCAAHHRVLFSSLVYCEEMGWVKAVGSTVVVKHLGGLLLDGTTQAKVAVCGE